MLSASTREITISPRLAAPLSLLLRYLLSLLFVFSAVFLSSALTTVNSQVEGATWPSFQASKENVTLTLPSFASAGTRTGP